MNIYKFNATVIKTARTGAVKDGAGNLSGPAVVVSKSKIPNSLVAQCDDFRAGWWDVVRNKPFNYDHSADRAAQSMYENGRAAAIAAGVAGSKGDDRHIYRGGAVSSGLTTNARRGISLVRQHFGLF